MTSSGVMLGFSVMVGSGATVSNVALSVAVGLTFKNASCR